MRSVWLLAPAVLAGTTSGYAAVYLTVDQAQAAMFPDATLTPVNVTLTGRQRAAIEKISGARVRPAQVRAWRVAGGGWFLVDEVLGKHEFITYAVGLDARGAVVGVEVLEYRETYGYEIRNKKWRAQFVGKTAAARLKFGDDIKNISGATLSCRHVTDGVKRLLATYEIVLQHL